MRTITRLLVGLTALLSIVAGLSFLINPEGAGARVYLQPIGTQGLATLRADFTTLFLTIGVFSFQAAWQARRSPLQVPAVIAVVAILARFFSFSDGMPDTAFPPLIVECGMAMILALGWRTLDPDNAR